MTMLSVGTVFCALTLICGGCTATPPPASVAAAPPAVAAAPQPGSIAKTPDAAASTADPWAYLGGGEWHGGWLHLRI